MNPLRAGLGSGTAQRCGHTVTARRSPGQTQLSTFLPLPCRPLLVGQLGNVSPGTAPGAAGGSCCDLKAITNQMCPSASPSPPPPPPFPLSELFGILCHLIKPCDAASYWMNMLNRSQWKAVLWGQGWVGCPSAQLQQGSTEGWEGQSASHAAGILSLDRFVSLLLKQRVRGDPEVVDSTGGGGVPIE